MLTNFLNYVLMENINFLVVVRCKQMLKYTGIGNKYNEYLNIVALLGYCFLFIVVYSSSAYSQDTDCISEVKENNQCKVVIGTSESNLVGVDGQLTTKSLTVDGHIKTQTIEITGGGDLAEKFNIRPFEIIKPGMVVSIDSEHQGLLKVSNKAYDKKVAGVIAGAGELMPGIVLDKNDFSKSKYTRNVALTGQIYCLADTSNGSIKPGDLLTTSDTPGHAMKVSDFTRSNGSVIGKAMSSLEDGQGLVLLLLTLQ